MQRKLLIILCLMGSVLITFAQKKKKNNNTEVPAKTDTTIDYKIEGASPMPALRVLHMMGKNNGNEIYTTKDIPAKKNVLVMMYNPTCGHCQEETILFKNNLEALKNTEVLLMADTVMKEYIDFFSSTTKVFDTPELKMVLDQCGFIKNTFIYKALPQINIYNKDKKLIKIFTGDTPIDSLKPYIQ